MFKINCDQQDIPCTVIDAYIAECKFPPKPGETNSRGELVTCYYDVVLQLQDASGNTDYWYGEISSRSGMGNNTHLYRLDLTLKTLHREKFDVESQRVFRAIELHGKMDATVSRLLKLWDERVFFLSKIANMTLRS